MLAAVRVIKPGMLTTVQDLGRWGLQARGVPVAGPMDPVSHRVANALVGNDPRAATLEVTLLGPELEFEDERGVAVCGAAFGLTVDGRAQATEARFVVSAGSRLRFGARQGGARAYVAVAGGIDAPLTLGSRATHLVSRMGGIDGRALKAGDRLPLGDARPGPPEGGHYGGGPARATIATVTTATTVVSGFSRTHVSRTVSGDPIIRILPGPQADYFAPDALAVLQSAPYVVRAQSDRMGFRLEGPALTHARGADIISDATPLGVLQVPASGQPILLMADRQTTGGYPKIATMISADVGAAGQLGPGDRVRFAVCTPQEALAALIAQERALMALEAAAS